MTLTQITLFFLGILVVIIMAMVVHSYLDKRKMRKGLRQLAQQLPGEVRQESRFHYPSFHSEEKGFDLFFSVVKVGRHHILYSIYTYALAKPLPGAFLLIKKETYRPIKEEIPFTEENGVLLSTVEDPFEGRSLSPEWAQHTYQSEGIKEALHALHSFSSLQLGPDAIVVGKPYEGDTETNPQVILRSVTILEALAGKLENTTTIQPVQ